MDRTQGGAEGTAWVGGDTEEETSGPVLLNIYSFNKHVLRLCAMHSMLGAGRMWTLNTKTK